MLTQEQLKQKLNYDPFTGLFTWKTGKYSGRIAGTVVGHLPDGGYIRIKINKKSYMAHRLAWLYVYGEFPTQLLDHKNRNRIDNRISNLREASDALNSKNQSLYKNNVSGFHGVTKHGNRWRARINVNGVKLHLGVFDTIEEAAECRKQAESKYGFYETHGSYKA